MSTIARAHRGRAFAFNARGGGAAFCIVIPFISAENVGSDPTPSETTVADDDPEFP